MRACAAHARGNLKNAGQNARLRMGGMVLLIALGAAVYLVQTDAARIWRLALFVPFFFAAFGAWQGLYRTCPGLVHRGCRETESGDEERVVRASEMALDRKLARRVMAGTILTAFTATTFVFLVP